MASALTGATVSVSQLRSAPRQVGFSW